MEQRVIRCVHAANLRDIKNGTYESDTVGVYYGFGNYNRTAKQIMTLVEVIKDELYGVELDEMEVYEITRAQSDRHAHCTMVYVSVSPDVVRENITDYTIL
jgi:hypothetical protein